MHRWRPREGTTDKPYRAATIARWFLAWAEHAEEVGLSNMKIQKLLYYAQGHYLAATGQPLFDDTIEAWSHGPVVPNVYHSYKGHGNAEIELPEEDEFTWADVDPDTTQFLIKVWNTYGGLAAWRLRNMTHDEPPWKDAFVEGERHRAITPSSLLNHFGPRTSVTS